MSSISYHVSLCYDAFFRSVHEFGVFIFCFGVVCPRRARVRCSFSVLVCSSRSVREFGVFMDIGWKRDALLHKNEVYQRGSCDPIAEFVVGQEVSNFLFNCLCPLPLIGACSG